MKRKASISEAAKDLGCHPRTLRAWISKDHAPHTRSRDGSIRVDAGEIQAWLAQSGRTGKPGRPVDDPLMEGGNSPNLERYRSARASQEELKLAVMRGELVSVAQIRDGFMMGMGVIRKAGEQLERLYGHAAAEALSEAVDGAVNVITRTLEAKPAAEGAR